AKRASSPSCSNRLIGQMPPSASCRCCREIEEPSHSGEIAMRPFWRSPLKFAKRSRTCGNLLPSIKPALLFKRQQCLHLLQLSTSLIHYLRKFKHNKTCSSPFGMCPIREIYALPIA